jgi:hypothetical protein
MNKYLIIAVGIGCIGLLSGCDEDADKTEMCKTYDLNRQWVRCDGDRQLYLIGEIHKIRELMEKQYLLDRARYQAGKKPNPLCEVE